MTQQPFNANFLRRPPAGASNPAPARAVPVAAPAAPLSASTYRWTMDEEQARQYGGFYMPSWDLQSTEDFSWAGAYRRAIDTVEGQTWEESNQEGGALGYPAPPNVQVADGIDRRMSVMYQLQTRVNALKYIVNNRPETLEQYPSIVAALAENPDFSEADARRLINVAELDAAFNAITSTQDPVAHKNIIVTMNGIQRAAFFDFFSAKVEEMAKQAAEDPSWIGGLWDVFYTNTIEPAFNALIWLNETSQQAFRANVAAIQDNPANALLPILSPGGGFAANAKRYWDDVAVGSYDNEYLQQLRVEYGSELVDDILRLEELSRDGEPDPEGRWTVEMFEKGRGWVTRRLFNQDDEDPELVALARKINSAHMGNTGMLALSGGDYGLQMPDSLRGSEGYAAAAGALNVAATLGLDPTIVAAKFIQTYRAAKYSLIRLSGVRGIDEASRMRAVRTELNELGRKMEAVRKNQGTGKAATIRQVISSQHGQNWSERVIDDMFEAGVKDADTAFSYLRSKEVTDSILRGNAGPVVSYQVDDAGQLVRSTEQTFQFADEGRLFTAERPILSRADDLPGGASLTVVGSGAPARFGISVPVTSTTENILSGAQATRRVPRMPSRTMAGALRARTRLLFATHNLLGRESSKAFVERFGVEGLVDAGVLGSRLQEEAFAYGAAQGVSPRTIFGLVPNRANPEWAKLLDEAVKSGGITADEAAELWTDSMSWLARSPRFGYGYTNKSVSARWDRVARRFAKRPFGLVVNLTDGRDANKVYQFARAFVSRQDAAIIAQAWREAPNIAARRAIHTGLIKTSAASRGVHYQSRFSKGLDDFLPEARRGGTYSPTITTQVDETGTFVPIIDDATAAVSASVDDGITSIPRTIERSPSNFDGNQHALHLWQTSENLAIPDMSVIEQYAVKSSLFDLAFGVTHGNIMTTITDTWSLFNLAGPRYFQRNALEDFAFYAMTAGRGQTLYKGRRASTAWRSTMGIQQDSGLLPRGGLTGGPVWKDIPPARNQLGVVNKRLFGYKKIKMQDDNPVVTSSWSVIKQGFSDTEKVAAIKAMQEGDLSKMRDLVAISIARQKFTGYTAADERYLLDFVSEHGEKMLDELNEILAYGASGRIPMAGLDVIDQTSRLGLNAMDGVIHSRLLVPRGEYASIAVSAENPFSFVYWHSGIIGAARNDGVIGTITIANLDQPVDDVVRKVARAIDDDVEFGYKERLSAFYTGSTTTDDFARRYVEDVRNLFANTDGTLNRELWEKILVTQDDGTRAVRLYRDGDLAITVDDLKAVPAGSRPAAVLGRSTGTVADATSIKAFDKMWSWMGQQYSRVSREPIFFANYLEARKLLEPLEASLAAQIGAPAAATRVSKLATDRAYLNTIRYTDNPADRTMLAWTTRNVARYYRATEDFARRFLRVAKNNPEGFWKVGLTYDVLDDTSFVYEDQYGEKYFVFPGSSQVIGVVNGIWQQLPGTGNGLLSLDGASFEMTGKVRMTTPSADPQQWIPTLSSPLAGGAVKLLVDAFPAFKSFERSLLGEYGENADFWRSILPGHALRLYSLIPGDERTGMYASAFRDAVQVAVAAGIAPHPNDPPAVYSEFMGKMDSLVMSMMIARVVGGFALMTSPQLTVNDVTQFAREKGIVNMDAAFTALIRVNEERGSQNPYADALVQFVETYGVERAPYSISEYEAGSGSDATPLVELNSVQATREGEQWVQDNQDLLNADNGAYRNAAAWLLPRKGEFSPSMMTWLQSAGFKVKKNYIDFFKQAQQSIGQYVLYGELEVVDERIRQAELAYYEAATSGTEAAKQAAYDNLSYLKYDLRPAVDDKVTSLYPGLDARQFTLTGNAFQLLLEDQIKPMIQWFYDQEGREIPDSVRLIAEAVATFELYNTQIGKITGQTRAEQDLKRLLNIEASMMLGEIGAENENAQYFIDRILLPMFKQGEMETGTEDGQR